MVVGAVSILGTTDSIEARSEVAQSTSVSPLFLPIIQRSGYSITFPESSSAILGSCSADVHDRYNVNGPDGNRYRTWHPVTVPVNASNPGGAKCSFAHEHGDMPHPSGPMPPFGYVSYVHGTHKMVAAHAGFKVFTHHANGMSGMGGPEEDYGGLPIDFMVVIHQGGSGFGRLTGQFHDFWFWSLYQGKETLITAMADTGSVTGKGCGSFGFERVIVDHCDPTYETWPYRVDIGGAWRSNTPLMAITNPHNHAHGSVDSCRDGECNGVTLVSTSEEICYNQITPCATKKPFGEGADNFWLGHRRTIHEPDWQWTNAGGSSTFCTDPYGVRQSCGLTNSILQTVAAVNVNNSSASQLIRTENAAGWEQTYWLPLGAPGGN